MSWWDAIDDYLRERERSEGEAPDPWGDVDLGESTLTDEQIDYLTFDQPGVPRVGRSLSTPDEPGVDEPGPETQSPHTGGDEA